MFPAGFTPIALASFVGHGEIHELVMNSLNVLNRFTSLPFLLDALSRRRLTLLNPRFWEDKNDAYYVAQYKKAKNLKTVLALCFTTRRGTFHHWKIFSNGSSGVCIEFNRNRLVNSLTGMDGYRLGLISYKFVDQVEKVRPPVDNWPFIKRVPFRDEGEFRIIYENAFALEHSKEIQFHLNCVNKITLSPWMPECVAQTVTGIIRSIHGCRNIRVNRSNLIEAARWRKAIENDSM